MVLLYFLVKKITQKTKISTVKQKDKCKFTDFTLILIIFKKFKNAYPE